VRAQIARDVFPPLIDCRPNLIAGAREDIAIAGLRAILDGTGARGTIGKVYFAGGRHSGTLL